MAPGTASRSAGGRRREGGGHPTGAFPGPWLHSRGPPPRFGGGVGARWGDGSTSRVLGSHTVCGWQRSPQKVEKGTLATRRVRSSAFLFVFLRGGTWPLRGAPLTKDRLNKSDNPKLYESEEAMMMAQWNPQADG